MKIVKAAKVRPNLVLSATFCIVLWYPTAWRQSVGFVLNGKGVNIVTNDVSAQFSKR
jgi:hypothetical protein